MKLGFCHLGFRVCSVRRVWYVTKRPSEEEVAVAEGDRSPLEREAAIPASELGVHGQLEREAPSLCFYDRLLCTTRKAPPSSGHAWLLRSVPGGLCASQMPPPPPTPDRPGLLYDKSLRHSHPVPFRVPPASQNGRERKRPRPRSCLSLWPHFGNLCGATRSPLNGCCLPLISRAKSEVFWSRLV